MKIKLKQLKTILNENSIEYIYQNNNGSISYIHFVYPSCYISNRMMPNFGEVLKVRYEETDNYICDDDKYLKQWVEEVIEEPEYEYIKIGNFNKFYNLIGTGKLYVMLDNEFRLSTLNDNDSKRIININWNSNSYYKRKKDE